MLTDLGSVREQVNSPIVRVETDLSANDIITVGNIERKNRMTINLIFLIFLKVPRKDASRLKILTPKAQQKR